MSKNNQIIEIEIDGVGMNGEGVGRYNGRVVFVPNSLVGERVLAKVIAEKKNFITAKIIKILQASEFRVKPICPVYYSCGGCQLMHIKEELHGEIKKNQVQNCLKKTAKLEFNVCDTINCGQNLEYRNKAQLPIGLMNGRIVVGYFKENSHEIIPFEKCYLHGEWADKIIEIFLDYANSQCLSVYNEREHKGLLRHLVLRKLGECVSVTVVVNGNALPNSKILFNAMSILPYNISLHININTGSTNVIMGDKTKLLFGNHTIECEIAGIKTDVSPQSFMQINTKVAEKIYKDTQEIISKLNNPIIIEGYSGVGVLSNIVAKFAKLVFSVEIVPQAVDNAKVLAKKNGNDNKITNICGDAKVEIPKIINTLQGTDRKDNDIVVLLDPPRKGCEDEIIRAIVNAKPDYIIYISCNPATLARDIAPLLEIYSPQSITPYDMFPMTGHVETLVCFAKRK